MKDRIIKFLTKEGITPAHFADEIGVQRSSVSHILSGRNNPSFDFIQKILQRYNTVNAEWLITGVGDIYKKTEKNITIVPDAKPDVKPKEPQVVQKDLFSDIPIPKIEQPSLNNITEKAFIEAPGKTVDKIIVFYSDKTFVEFKPS